MLFTRKDGRNAYFNEYYIVHCINCESINFTTFTVKSSISDKTKYYTDKDVFLALLNNLNEVADDTNIAFKTKKKKQQLCVFVNKACVNFLPDYDNIRYIVYDKILYEYTNRIDINDTFKNIALTKINKISKEINYYIDKIGLVKFPKSDHATFATLARRSEENRYPDLINYNVAKEYYMKRELNFELIQDYITPLKKYNANNLVSRDSSYEVIHDCMKIDINSSFVLTPMVYKTHLNSAFKTYNKRLNLDDNTNPYLALIKVPTYKLKVIDDRYPNWLTMTTKRWNKKKVPYIPVTNITWEDIKFTYGLTKDDVEVVNYVEGRWNYYSCYQQQVYLKEHENKAYYKQHHMKYEKQISKTATYSMHGNALNNQITNEGNEDYYRYRKSTPCLKDHPADGFLTTYDATLMYENARHHLLKLISLFDTIYYYDTDCVVVPNTKENKLKVEEYNNWIKELYSSVKKNWQEYTHDNHTIGFAEVEEEYDAFYYISGKQYFYVCDNKLHSITAGFEADTVADKICKDSQLEGEEALKWLINQTSYECNFEFYDNGSTNIMHRCFMRNI